MIEMISGVCSSKSGLKRPGDGAFSLSPKEEARLVRRGVARYTNEVAADPAPVEPVLGDTLGGDIGPIGFDDMPPADYPGEDVEVELVDLESLSAKELRQYAKENYSLTFKGNASKAEMLQRIGEAAAAEYAAAVEAGIAYECEDVPNFDPSEAVV